MAFSQARRLSMANSIVENMEIAYEEEGIEGDFDDARRYLRDDASDEELRNEYVKWVPSEEQEIF